MCPHALSLQALSHFIIAYVMKAMHLILHPTALRWKRFVTLNPMSGKTLC